jgi:hypothetical protein
MPSTPKRPRIQTRLNPNPGQQPPEVIELVDPAWILKALGLMLLFALLCALATIAYFHHYQLAHSKPASPSQTAQPNPANTTRP